MLPLVAVFLTVVTVEGDLVDGIGVSLRRGLLIIRALLLGGLLLFAAECDANLRLLRLGSGQQLVIVSGRVL